MNADERAALPGLARLLAALLVAFAVLVALGLHGFSFARWHDLLDGSPQNEVLLGQARYIRVDDWMVRIPLALAQSAHDPPFPLVNENIGSGQNMLLPLAVPVAHPVTLFRPTLWGYFLGDDVGMSWAWWSQSLGLLAVWLALLFVVTRGRLGLSLAGALLFWFSPYFQAFSFTYASAFTYAGVAWLAALGIALSRRPFAVLGCGLLLGHASAAFALVLYPAYQVPLGYLGLVVVGGSLWERRAEIDWWAQPGLRLAALGLAALVAGAACLSFYRGAGNALAAVLGSDYPGGRISSGGDAPLFDLFTAHLALLPELGVVRPDETLSFLYLFPVLLLPLAWLRLRGGVRPDPMTWGLALLCVGALLYRSVGLPEWLSRASLMSFVPAHRLAVVLGAADLLLLARFCALPTREGRDTPWWLAALVALVFALWLAFAGRALQELHGEIRTGWLALAIAANLPIAFLVARRWRPELVLAASACLLALSTGWFNPLARGGSQFVKQHPLARAILAIDAESAGDTVWASIGNSDRANLFRMLGVASIGGAHMVPQLELWQRLDPQGRSRAIYNRYAHVSFALGNPRFQLRSHHGFRLYVDARLELLHQLGVTHALVHLPPGSRWLPFWEQARSLASVGDYRLYALPLTPLPPPDSDLQSAPAER